MSHPALLVELLTEELPPKSLRLLGQTFADEIFNGLVHHQLKQRVFTGWRVFATPRRLGVLIPDVRAKADDRETNITGPSVKAGLDSAGAPTPALTGFARKNGIDVAALEQQDSPKGRVFVGRVKIAGSTLDAVLAGIVRDAIKKLPIAKMMRWGDGDDQFVRPVHKLVLLHGTRVVPGSVLGHTPGNETQGHRFMSSGAITLAHADEYEAKLKDPGNVVPVFDDRKASIEAMLSSEAKRLGAGLGEYEDLLDEVTALVEHPSVYVGTFDKAFLEVPQECLILTMRQNQKYFPLFNAQGRLLPQFLIVSNMRVADPSQIVQGNERVVRPRLEDARFFYNQDRRVRLEERVPQLSRMVYHNKLGSQLERVERVQLLSGAIARALGADAEHAERAAWLAKADLLTGMVGEFPELQGVMGRYYALHDGEAPQVADAIEAHYHPRFAGDTLPAGPVAAAVALADKLDTLVGIFGIGLAPTGDKDPFALRRHALGIVRILAELGLPLELDALIGLAREQFRDGRIAEGVEAEAFGFVLERLRGYLREQGYTANEIEAVVSLLPKRIDQVRSRLDAVRAFAKLPEAESLAAANKRIRNILHKSAPAEGGLFQGSKLAAAEEKTLYDAFTRIDEAASAHLGKGRYTEALTLLAALKAPVDAFFDAVMVNVEDAELRNNRLLLLMQLNNAMNRVADISKLAA
jgi:glycyl-tRNA synthetase beta chain